MPTRYDITDVPAQGGYIAKRCPVIAHNAHDPTIEVEPLPVAESLQLMFDRGIAFEEEVFGQLAELHHDAIVVDRSKSRADREVATSQAMDDGALLVIGGRLPADPEGKRVGEPDLLVRHRQSTDGWWSYLPVDVKHHLTLSADADQDGPPVSSFDHPAFDHASQTAGSPLRRNEGDALQLAHYYRMLEFCGHAASDPVSGIVGKELVIVWYDLDEPLWWSGGKRRTTLERYDFEFDFRLDIIAVAQQRGADPDIDPLVVPVRIPDCDGCEWWGLCGPVLEESDDVSLLPRIGWPQWRDLRLGGITARDDLARLDWTTASLIQDGVDLRTYLDNAPNMDQDTAVLDVIGRRRTKQGAVLTAAGFHTAGDAERIDRTTVDVAYARGDKPVGSLASQIDMARAGIGPHLAYRKRGVEAIVVPRADVEIDVDMENSVDGSAYLWGALVSEGTAEPVYHSFVTWEPLDPEGSERQSVFAAFWDWLSELVATTESSGLAVAVYCYSRQAEERHMRQGTIDDKPKGEAVEALIASERWVDMRTVFEDQLITGKPVGLKVVADLAGFEWQDDDPGGAASMVWYEKAVAGDEEARARLLSYNEDDVRATNALRDWIDRSIFPTIGDWECG